MAQKDVLELSKKVVAGLKSELKSVYRFLKIDSIKHAGFSIFLKADRTLSRKDFWLKLFKATTTWESPRPTLKLKCSSYLVKVIFASPGKK